MFDDPTGIQDDRKQEALNTILFNIKQLLHHGKDGDIVSETVSDISLKDIDAFLNEISREQSTDIKLFRVRSSYIKDPALVENLYEYIQIQPQGRREYKQITYFIESGDFALAFIPVDEGRGDTRIHMEPLECCPDFITELYNDLDNRKGLESIEFVKLTTKGN